MELNKYIDHTYLKAFGSKNDIMNLCMEAKKYNFKSVCVNPAFIEYAKKLLDGSDTLVCTVIGFPLGQNTTETKVFETVDAINKGADEVDMVINVIKLKDKDYDYVLNEIKPNACTVVKELVNLFGFDESLLNEVPVEKNTPKKKIIVKKKRTV